MGKAITMRAGLGKAHQGSEEMQARYALLRALAHKEHIERVHQIRVKLAFERLAREYPTLNAARLWAMAHSALRMAQTSHHAQYAEQRFMA